MTPRTEAGRALLNDWMHDEVLNRLPPRGLVSEQVEAIEREAVEAYAARLREAVEKELRYSKPLLATGEPGRLWRRNEETVAAVLDLIEREKG